jgi:hypothetical protein
VRSLYEGRPSNPILDKETTDGKATTNQPITFRQTRSLPGRPEPPNQHLQLENT